MTVFDKAAVAQFLREVFPARSWRDSALCTQFDPRMNLWFPNKGKSAKEAKRICSMCPVRRECEDEVLSSSHEYGIWAGTTERQRLGRYRKKSPIGTQPKRLAS